MNNISRNHHYIPQFYLRGFTINGKKNSQLIVIDSQDKKMFETNIKNVGIERDFNRVDIEGLEPDEIEKLYSIIESDAAKAIKNIEKNCKFEGEDKDVISILIALLVVRSPERREDTRKFHEEVADFVLRENLSSKEIYEKKVKEMFGDNCKVDYQSMKEFYESKRYKIEVPRELYIISELAPLFNIFPYIKNREWSLLKSTKESGPFITSDNPVSRFWREPDKERKFYQDKLGFDNLDVIVYFPLSKDFALVGDFEGSNCSLFGNRELVASLNRGMIHSSNRQIYLPTKNFFYIDDTGSILEGECFLKQFKTK